MTQLPSVFYTVLERGPLMDVLIAKLPNDAKSVKFLVSSVTKKRGGGTILEWFRCNSTEKTHPFLV